MSTGPRCPPSSYEQAVEDYGDDAFAPFQAELFFGMNVDTPALRVQRAPAGDHAGDRPRRDRARRSTRTWPTRWPPWSPPASRATTRTAARRAPPTPSGPPTSSPSPSPDGDVPTVHLDYDETPAQEAMADLVADSLEAVGIPTELRPLPLDEYRGVRRVRRARSSSASGGSAPTCRPMPTSLRCSGRPPTTTSPASGPPTWTPCSRTPEPAPAAPRTRARWARAEEEILDGRGRRADRPVPHPGGRRRPCRGPPHRGGRHRRLGPGEPHRLTRTVGRSGGVRLR